MYIYVCYCVYFGIPGLSMQDKMEKQQHQGLHRILYNKINIETQSQSLRDESENLQSFAVKCVSFRYQFSLQSKLQDFLMVTHSIYSLFFLNRNWVAVDEWSDLSDAATRWMLVDACLELIFMGTWPASLGSAMRWPQQIWHSQTPKGSHSYS